jgi:hypothetical protein
LKIAIVGCGYLIWDPRGMDLEPEWHADGPLLPVEFARFSSGPVLMPVLVESVPLQPTLGTRSGRNCEGWSPLVACAARRLADGRSSTFCTEDGGWALEKRTSANGRVRPAAAAVCQSRLA